MKKRWDGLFVAAIAGAAYVRAGFAEVFWDDEYLSTRNPYLSTLEGIRFLVSHDLWIASAKGEPGGYWRPLASLSLALNRAAAGNSAASYHAGNVLLHAAVSAALVVFARRLGLGRWVAAVIGLWFATTPLGSEAVVWISGRFDLLGALLTVVACILHISRRPLGCALALAGALACKETFFVAPVMLAGYELFVGRGPMRARRWLAGPGLALLAIFTYSAARAWVGVSSATQAAAISGGARLLPAFSFVVTTLHRGLVAPSTLSPFHAYAPESTVRACATLAMVAVVSTGFAFIALRRGASKPVKIAAFGWLWWMVGITPTSLTAANQFVVGDRYAYFPMIGLALAAGGLVAAAAPRLRARSFVALAVGLAALGALQTVSLQRRVTDWQTAQGLLEVTYARDPGNFYAAAALGEHRARHGRFAEAEVLLVAAQRAAPGRSESGSGFTWPIETALCFVYLNEGRYAEGEAACRSRIAQAPHDPRAWLNLATIQLRQGRFPEAAQAAAAAIARKPTYVEARLVRAMALRALGQPGDARAEAERVLRLDAGNVRAKALATGQ